MFNQPTELRSARVLRAVSEFCTTGTQSAALPDFLARIDADIRGDVENACRVAIEIDRLGLRTSGAPAGPPEDLGGFRLKDPIGQGSMGWVFRAEDVRLGRQVALKVLRNRIENATTAETRFITEARLLARLDHEGIVKVHGAGESGGWRWIAMELLPGPSLRAQIDTLAAAAPTSNTPDRGRFRPIARLLGDIVAALGHAHAHGIVHRDVKPENVLLDAGGRPQLVDFGIARHRDMSTLTDDHALMGTLPYLPPEAFDGRSRPGPAYDLWAVGVLAYELIALRRPFRGPTPAAIQAAILRGAPARLGRYAPAVPADLQRIVMKLLAPRPADRYVSALAAGEDLQRFLGGKPLVDAAFSPLHAVALHLDRHRRSWLIAASLVLCTMAASWWAARAADVTRFHEETSPLVALALDPELGTRPIEDLQTARVRALQVAGIHVVPFEARTAVTEALVHIEAEARDRAKVEAAALRRTMNELLQGRREPGDIAPVQRLAKELANYCQARQTAGGFDPREFDTLLSATISVPRFGDDQSHVLCCRQNLGDGTLEFDGATEIRGQGGHQPMPPGLWSFRWVVAGRSMASTTVAVDHLSDFEVRCPSQRPEDFDIHMVVVPAGDYPIGRDSADGGTMHPGLIRVQEFRMSESELTCEQFYRIYQAHPEAIHRPPDPFREGCRDYLTHRDDWGPRPVIGVLFDDALRIATVVGCTLPTWSQWQAAARGPSGGPLPPRVDPAHPERGVALRRGSGVSQADVPPVLSSDADVSWCGIHDLLGSAYEWTLSPYVHDRGFLAADLLSTDRLVFAHDFRSAPATIVPDIGLAYPTKYPVSSTSVGIRLVQCVR